MPVVAAPGNKRQVAAEERRQTILDAALDIFAEHGYAAARLGDVAARAGIAKGTIYLHFADKRTLFMDLARGAAAPMFDVIVEVSATDAPIDQLLRTLVERFDEQVLGTRRKEVFRLVITESARFPEIAEFYHREIISRLIPLLQVLLTRAHERGELASDAAARFPQLLIAPMVVGLLWDGMFGAFDPLDARAMFAAHIELLTGRKEFPA